jgi:hypothetical protein
VPSGYPCAALVKVGTIRFDQRIRARRQSLGLKFFELLLSAALRLKEPVAAANPFLRVRLAD